MNSVLEHTSDKLKEHLSSLITKHSLDIVADMCETTPASLRGSSLKSRTNNITGPQLALLLRETVKKGEHDLVNYILPKGWILKKVDYPKPQGSIRDTLFDCFTELVAIDTAIRAMAFESAHIEMVNFEDLLLQLEAEIHYLRLKLAKEVQE